MSIGTAKPTGIRIHRSRPTSKSTWIHNTSKTNRRDTSILQSTEFFTNRNRIPQCTILWIGINQTLRPSKGSIYNSPERTKAFTQKYGVNAMTENYNEVGILYTHHQPKKGKGENQTVPLPATWRTQHKPLHKRISMLQLSRLSRCILHSRTWRRRLRGNGYRHFRWQVWILRTTTRRS